MTNALFRSLKSGCPCHSLFLDRACYLAECCRCSFQKHWTRSFRSPYRTESCLESQFTSNLSRLIKSRSSHQFGNAWLQETVEEEEEAATGHRAAERGGRDKAIEATGERHPREAERMTLIEASTMLKLCIWIPPDCILGTLLYTCAAYTNLSVPITKVHRQFVSNYQAAPLIM